VRDGLGDELLFGVAQRRVLVAAVQAHERVPKLMTDDVDAGVDGRSSLTVRTLACGSHEPPWPLASVR